MVVLVNLFSPVEPGLFYYFFTQVIKQFTLNKKERLKKRSYIEQLFREGKTFAYYPVRAYYLHQPGPNIPDETGWVKEGSTEAPVQFGCGVSKKHFKKATDRNRVKRLIREAYRLQKLPLLSLLVQSNKAGLKLFLIFTGKELPSYQLIKEKVASVLQRLGEETQE